jgi:hypothetical protein
LTEPISMPRKSTGASTAMPRIDWSNTMRTRCGGPSGGASACLRSGYRTKRLPSPAGGRPRVPGGRSNDTPPASTEASVCVLTVRPLLLSETSTPLAFQKRVWLLTSLSYGASMKTCTEQLVDQRVERVAHHAAHAVRR